MIIAPSITSLCFPVDEVHRRFPLPGHDIKDTTWKNERITILMQYSLHLPSRHMLREIAFVFPKNSNIVTSSTTDASITTTNETEAVKIMACFLRSDNDLIHVSEQTNRERDVLLATVKVI